MAVTFTTADRIGGIGGYIGGISALLGNGGIGGILGNNGVSRETFDLSMKLSASERDNAILTAELSSEKKMVEVYNAGIERTNKVRDELLAEIRAVDKKVDDGFAAQAVINCKANSAIALLQDQVKNLYGMTKLGILNDSLWPAPTP